MLIHIQHSIDIIYYDLIQYYHDVVDYMLIDIIYSIDYAHINHHYLHHYINTSGLIPALPLGAYHISLWASFDMLPLLAWAITEHTEHQKGH